MNTQCLHKTLWTSVSVSLCLVDTICYVMSVDTFYNEKVLEAWEVSPSPNITVQCSIDVKIEEPRVHSSGGLAVRLHQIVALLHLEWRTLAVNKRMHILSAVSRCGDHFNHCNGNFRRLFYVRSATKHIQCSWDKVDVYNVTIMLIKVMTKVFCKAGRRILQVLSLCFTHMAWAASGHGQWQM